MRERAVRPRPSPPLSWRSARPPTPFWCSDRPDVRTIGSPEPRVRMMGGPELAKSEEERVALPPQLVLGDPHHVPADGAEASGLHLVDHAVDEAAVEAVAVDL